MTRIRPTKTTRSAHHQTLVRKIWATAGVPLLPAIFFLGAWEILLPVLEIPPFVLPTPGQIGASLLTHFSSLMASLWITLRITVLAFLLAVLGGVAIAVLFSQSRTLERAFYPYAVMVQVTPLVAIAPLVLIWVGLDQAERALLILAWVSAFFPILSNTVLGLRSANHNLRALFALYGASRWQTLRYLLLPSAAPFLLAGMKISGGLALVGTVVAEFVAGSGSSAGLAWRIIEAGNRLEMAKVFAALTLLAFLGITVFAILSLLERRLLRHWHESATPPDGFS